MFFFRLFGVCRAEVLGESFLISLYWRVGYFVYF